MCLGGDYANISGCDFGGKISTNEVRGATQRDLQLTNGKLMNQVKMIKLVINSLRSVSEES